MERYPTAREKLIDLKVKLPPSIHERLEELANSPRELRRGGKSEMARVLLIRALSRGARPRG